MATGNMQSKALEFEKNPMLQKQRAGLCIIVGNVQSRQRTRGNKHALFTVTCVIFFRTVGKELPHAVGVDFYRRYFLCTTKQQSTHVTIGRSSTR